MNNGQTYTMTAALAFTTLGNAVLQGFASSVGDLGKATFTSNLTSAVNFTCGSSSGVAFVDLIFANTGASNANGLFTVSAASVDTVFLRCVFHGARGAGLSGNTTGGGGVFAIECEAYDCDKSNTASQAGFVSASTGGTMFCYNCYSHDNTSANANGFETFSNSSMILVNCTADTNGGCGAKVISGATGLFCFNCNFYNNSVDGVNFSQTSANAWSVLMNNNFLKNTGAGVNNTVTAQGGILYNNGRGAGAQANGSADTLKSIVNTSTDITYASGATPWKAPTTGDFSTVLGAAIEAGRGAFTETDGTNTGTVGYPDIGAAQARVDEGIGALMGGLRPTV